MKSGINDAADTAPVPRMKAAHSNVWADVEHDGDLDLLVGGLHKAADGRPNFLFRNEVGSRNAFLAIRLQSDTPKFNRDAIGARVQLVYPDRVLSRELKSSRGMYDSSDTRWMHFGLGSLGCAPRILVRWPNGELYRFEGATFGQNRFVTIRYGEGTFLPTPTATSTALAWPTDTPGTPGAPGMPYHVRLPSLFKFASVGGR
jgi:hypothetical protein